MTAQLCVGIIANIKAELITRFHDIADNETGVEMVVWRVSVPLSPSEHCYKYRLVYLVSGTRVVGFDNERGKGDHRHVGNIQLPYEFSGIDQLIDDFIEGVARWKREH